MDSDIEKMHEWASKWLVTFNPTKSETIIFSRKRNEPFHPPIVMDQKQIHEVSSHKLLGAFLSNDCTCHEHMEYLKHGKE